MGLVVFIALVALLEAHVRGQKSALARMEAAYQQRSSAWAVAHPGSVRSARWAGVAGAVIHGTIPAARAYGRDWRKHYLEGRDRARAKYRPPEPVEAEDPYPSDGVIEHGHKIPDEQVAQPEAPPRKGRGWVKDWQPIIPTDKSTEYPPLRAIPGGKDEGTAMPTITEIRTIADVRKAVEDYAARKRAEVEDATAALNRAKADLQYLTSLGEQGSAVLDKDPGTAAAVQSLVESEQQRISAEQGRVASAEGGLARAQAALSGLARHRAMEEATAATPQASSNTNAYKPQ